MLLNGTELVVMLKNNSMCERLDNKCHLLHERKKSKKRMCDIVYTHIPYIYIYKCVYTYVKE